jgi:hypothetical protein
LHYSAPNTEQAVTLALLLTLLEPVLDNPEHNDEQQIQRDEDTLHCAGFVTWRAPRAMWRRALFAGIAAALFTFTLARASYATPLALAGNGACWGDDTRQDISCMPLTERFLLSLPKKTKEEVQKAMGVLGSEMGETLHFISIARVQPTEAPHNDKPTSTPDGVVNFLFDEDDRATAIFGLIDCPSGESREFVWNASVLPAACSDQPMSRLERCAAVPLPRRLGAMGA